MNLALKTLTIGLLSSTAVLIVPAERTADARTINAMAGMPGNPFSATCFSLNSFFGMVMGPASSTCSGAKLVIPLAFDTAGSKTIIATGAVTAGGALTCQAFAYNNNGTIASQSASQSWSNSINTIYQLTFTLNTVNPGGTGVLACQFISITSNTGLLQQVDYNP
jgi:hypothetical protein